MKVAVGAKPTSLTPALGRRFTFAVMVLLAACDANGERPGGENGSVRPAGALDAAPADGLLGQKADPGSGILRGRVVYRGPLPATTEMHIPEAGFLEAHTIVVDSPDRRGLKNAVVWIEGARPRSSASRLAAVVLDQRNWTFVPHVVALRVGQPVHILNTDIANHTVHSFSPGFEFNVGTPAGEVITQRFRRPTGTSPARLQCDIHDWMLAWVYVFRHEAFAVTDAHGNFRIEGAPAGEQRLRAHHADGRLEASALVLVKPDGETEVEVEIRSAKMEPEGEERR